MQACILTCIHCLNWVSKLFQSPLKSPNSEARYECPLGYPRGGTRFINPMFDTSALVVRSSQVAMACDIVMKIILFIAFARPKHQTTT